MADLLFLAHRIPFPPDRGDKIRSFHMLQALSRRARVHLACFGDDEADAGHLAGLRQALGGALGEAHVEVRRVSRPLAALKALATGRPLSVTLFDSSALHGAVQRLLAERPIGTIVAFSSQMAQYVPADGRRRFVMDFVDMDSAKFADYAAAGGPLRLVHAREARRLLAFERATAARADISLFVSEAEATMFRARIGARRVAVIGNGVDLDGFRPGAVPGQPTGEGPVILFTGQMDYRPNIAAVRAFADDVLPLILAERPDARFVIAGRAPSREVLRLAGPAVEVTGAVPDMRSWLAAASVVVAPLAIGRGGQNKVLEAMAMARPVVASTAAFTGIDAEPGRDLLVADGVADQARAVLGLLADPEAAGAIGRAARVAMERSYSWEARLARLSELAGLPPLRDAA